MKALSPEPQVDDVPSSASIRAQLDASRREQAGAQVTAGRLADEVARLLATGSDPRKAEEASSRATANVASLRTRIEALERLLVRAEAKEAEEAKKVREDDAEAQRRDAEGKHAESRARLVCSLKGVLLDFADLRTQNARAQQASDELGPGIGTSAADPTSWHFLQTLLDEVTPAAFEAAKATQEAARVSLTLRIPRLPEVQS